MEYRFVNRYVFFSTLITNFENYYWVTKGEKVTPKKLLVHFSSTPIGKIDLYEYGKYVSTYLFEEDSVEYPLICDILLLLGNLKNNDSYNLKKNNFPNSMRGMSQIVLDNHFIPVI